MQLCAITDRSRLAAAGEGEAATRRELRGLIADWIDGGAHFIQIREKDLDLSELYLLTEDLLAGLDRRQSKVLVNLPPRPDWIRSLVPLTDGVHIPGKLEGGSVARVREAFRASGRSALVSASCHSLEEVRAAKEERVDFVLFAPVFEKRRAPEPERSIAPERSIPGDAPSENPSQAGTPHGVGKLIVRGLGLEALRAACQIADPMLVFALGGVTVENAPACVTAGAAGVSGIRLFVEGGWRRLAAPRPIYS